MSRAAFQPLEIPQRESEKSSASPAMAPAAVGQVLRGSGQPLDGATRGFMESRFGWNFGSVRVFHDGEASASARAVSAHAYTVGDKVVFGAGRYQPHSQDGRKLLAHELAHVVQQTSAGGSSGALRLGAPSDAHESAADRAAQASLQESSGGEGRRASGQHAAALAAAGPVRGPVVQRLSYAEIKESAYRGLVNTARKATQGSIRLLRLLASHLPASLQGEASMMIDIADYTIGAIFAVILAVIGIIVGAGEGVAGMVQGLVTLLLAVTKVLYDVISGFFTNFDAAKQDWHVFVQVLTGLPSAIKLLVVDWLDRFQKAPSERQSLMIGELTGQIIALIGTFALSAGRAGTAAKIGSEGIDATVDAANATSKLGKAGDAAATGGKAGNAAAIGGKAADAGITAAKTRPALQLLQGGGGSAARASGGGAAVARGAAAGRAGLALARDLAPEIEEAPRFVPQLVPPEAAPVVAPAAQAAAQTTAKTAGSAGKAAAVGKALAVGKSVELADPKNKKRPPFVLNLPKQKEAHLGRYRALLGQLESDPQYDRGAPAQRDKWDKALRIGGSHPISQSVYERGHSLGLTGEAGETLIRIPNWTRHRTNTPMEVDHIIELQVAPASQREYYDHMDFYELLDRSANGNSGNVLRANIAAERAKQAAFDPTTVNQVLKFDAVDIKGGISGERWTLDEIQTGEQLDFYKSK